LRRAELRRGCLAGYEREALADDHAENVLPRNGPVDSAIGGVHAIIAQEEELVFTACDKLFLDFATGVSRHAIGQVRLLKFCAIDIYRAVFQENGIATNADDAFDGIAFG